MRKWLLQRRWIVVVGIAAGLFGPGCLATFGQDHFREGDLPTVLSAGEAELVGCRLKEKARSLADSVQKRLQLTGWKTRSEWLRAEVIKKSGAIIDPGLDLDWHETGTVQLADFKVVNLYFQVRQGVYATANLYVPAGKGPFPAVIHMPGHWEQAKLDSGLIEVGSTLARNGYVCLTIDPWGAGERSRIHGTSDYHGANLGASLMNVGETLLGVQLSDNIRGVDLLSSLAFVDASRVGATGASGGGSQALWLAAIDTRIKSVVTVVSAGTFEAFVMNKNCVCELLPDGLTFTEEFEIVGLIAPRSIRMISHRQDANPAFSPDQMIRTYQRAAPLFAAAKASEYLDYKVINATHGYYEEDRRLMISWFNRHLKRDSTTSISTGTSPFRDTAGWMVFPRGKRDYKVQTTSDYCQRKGADLRAAYLRQKKLDAHRKRTELKELLRVKLPAIASVQSPGTSGIWERFSIKTTAGHTIPLLIAGRAQTSSGRYRILVHPDGKSGVDKVLITSLRDEGSVVVIPELSGTGELTPESEKRLDRNRLHHLRARSELWVGQTIQGQWVEELTTVVNWLKSQNNVADVVLEGVRETALATLFTASLTNGIREVILRDAPVSYWFDPSPQGSVDYYSMAAHLPGFLNWGDLSLTASLSGADVIFVNPRTMAGVPLNAAQTNDFTKEYKSVRRRCRTSGKTFFIMQ